MLQRDFLITEANGLFSGSRIDDRPNLRDAVGGETALLRVLPDSVFIRRDVDAVNFVVGNVAVNPLNLRAHVSQYAARLLGNGLQLLWRQLSHFRNVSLDDELRHAWTPHFLALGQAQF